MHADSSGKSQTEMETEGELSQKKPQVEEHELEVKSAHKAASTNYQKNQKNWQVGTGPR